MGITTELCNAKSLSGFIELLDQEFIYGRGRRLSLAARYPNVLSQGNVENILIAHNEGVLCGGAAARLFQWFDGDRQWSGAMIGMVCTSLEYRGRGVGGAVLMALGHHLQERAIDFGVLWTTIPAFYERLGWRTLDQGVFGRVASLTQYEPVDATESLLCSVDLVPHLETARTKWLPQRVFRTALDYRVTPAACDSVRVFGDAANNYGDGYALVGEHATTGYVFEMVGALNTLERLWRSVASRYATLYVNERAGSPLETWLAQNAAMVWAPQSQAMWMRFSGHRESPWDQWHIPYFDRI